MHPFPAVGLVFAVFFFFSRRIPSWIPPFPSLVGRFLVTLRALLVEIGVFFLRYGFCELFLMIFDCFLSGWGCPGSSLGSSAQSKIESRILVWGLVLG